MRSGSWLFTLFLCVVLSHSARASFDFVEDFSAGLGAWTATGAVATVNEEVRLADDEATAFLYQGIATPPGSTSIEFDFNNNLSPDFNQGTFLDSFFASLFFVDDLNQFDLLGSVFDDSLALLDLDAQGAFNVNGDITPSDKGPDWLHFSATFVNNYAYVIPVFEVNDLNLVAGDSEVLIDNVVIAVPEARGVALLLVGMSLALGRRRRLRRAA